MIRMNENKEPIRELAHEITYRRYILSKDDTKIMFHDINLRTSGNGFDLFGQNISD